MQLQSFPQQYIKAVSSGRFIPVKVRPVPTEQEAGWAPVPV